MTRKIVVLFCMIMLMIFPLALADSPVNVALLDHYEIADGEAYLVLAFEAPEDATWKLMTDDGEAISSEASNYRVVSWSEQAGEKHRILVFRGFDPEYTTDDLALSVSYTADGSEEVNELYTDFGERISAEARSEYGYYDFGGFCGYVSEVFIDTSEPFAEIELRIKHGYFSDYMPIGLYTNAAEQFKFYAKDGTPLAEALGCGEFEITSGFSPVVTFKGALQVEGRFDDDNIKKMIAENFGYVEYTKDNGEIMRLGVQYVQYYRGNGAFERVDILM